MSADILLEAIDETLSFMSETSKRIVYHHFHKRYGVGPGHIPNLIDDFHEVLRFYFGDQATKIIEKMIAKRFCEKQGVQFVWREYWTLKEYIEKPKRQLDPTDATILARYQFVQQKRIEYDSCALSCGIECSHVPCLHC